MITGSGMAGVVPAAAICTGMSEASEPVRFPLSKGHSVKISITLQDDAEGRVRVEEVRRPGPGEPQEAVTAASALAEEMLAILDELGEAETVSEDG